MKKNIAFVHRCSRRFSLSEQLQSLETQRQQVWMQRNHEKTPIQYWGCRVAVQRGLWHCLLPAAALESPLDITEVSWVPQAPVSLQVIHQRSHRRVIVLTDGIEVQLRIATYTVIKTGSLRQARTLWSRQNMVTCKIELVWSRTCLWIQGKYFYVTINPNLTPF